MSECNQYEQCQNHFEAIHRKIDRLDQSIRGNGKLGILVRLDRLEQIEAARKRTTWLVLGAFASAAGSVLLHLIQLFGG